MRCEKARMLKPDGCLPQALIDWCIFETYFGANQRKLSFVKIHQQFLQDGNVDPEHAPPLGYGHLTTQTEFRQLFETEFDQVAMIGLESFSAPFLPQFIRFSEQVEAWMDLVETTGQTPEGLVMSDHFLYIGKKQ